MWAARFSDHYPHAEILDALPAEHAGLKYAGFELGERVRAYDFEPIPGRSDRYIEGRIIGFLAEPFAAYIVDVDVDASFPEQPRERVAVPLETTFDYEGRVVATEVRA